MRAAHLLAHLILLQLHVTGRVSAFYIFKMVYGMASAFYRKAGSSIQQRQPRLPRRENMEHYSGLMQGNRVIPRIDYIRVLPWICTGQTDMKARTFLSFRLKSL